MNIELNYIDKFFNLKHETFREEIEQSRTLEIIITNLSFGITPKIDQLKSLRMKEVRNQILINDDEDRICIF